MTENTITLQQILARLNADYGTGAFVADEKGCYRVQCDEVELTILGREDGRSVLFFAPVIEVPADLQAKLALIILQVNHLFQGAEGASFSMDAQTQCICLQEEIVLEDDAEGFARRMAHFLSAVERWYVLLGAYIEGVQSGKGVESPLEKPTAQESGLPAIPSEWLAV